MITNKISQQRKSNLCALYTLTESVEEFQQRLESSPLKENRCYLGLLMMTAVSAPMQRVPFIRTLIKYGADINFAQPTKTQNQSQRIKENDKSFSGKSVLMVACEKSITANVKYLLQFQYLQVGYCDPQGRTALNYALLNQQEEEAVQIIEMILKEFPHLVEHRNASNQCFLFECINLSKLKILHLLLTKFIDPNQQFEPAGLTALHYAISLSGQKNEKEIQQILLLLLKLKSDPRKKNFLSEDSFEYADKYLFSLEKMIEMADNFNFQNEPKSSYKQNTMKTYADSKTTFSKDEDESDYFKNQVNFYENAEQNKGILEGSFSSFKHISHENHQIEVHHQNQQNQQSKEQQEYLCQQQNIEKYNNDKGQSVNSQNQNGIKYQQIKEQTDEQHNLNENYQSFAYDQTTIRKLERFHFNFSQKIWEFYLCCQKQYEQAWKDIQQLFDFLQKKGHKKELVLDMIGSFATGLWTPHSDIDLVFINQKAHFVDINQLLQSIHESLSKNVKKLDIKQLYLNSHIKFPNIKLKLGENRSNRRIQISIFQRKCSGRKYVSFILQKLSMYPQISPIFFFFHKLLENFDLHRPTKKGIKNYTLFLMILDIVQYNPNVLTLSQLFCSFVNCYHERLSQSEISMQKDQTPSNPGEEKERINLDIMDPLNPCNNTTGKQTSLDILLVLLKALKTVLLSQMQQSMQECDNTKGQYTEIDDQQMQSIDDQVQNFFMTVMELHRMFKFQ